MGPPLKAAENIADDVAKIEQTEGFNGAAAKSSGKFCSESFNACTTNTLQWAAAKSSGKSRSSSAMLTPCVLLHGAAAKSSGKCAWKLP